MMELINDIIGGQAGEQLGNLFLVAGLSAFMFFIPYPVLSLSDPCKQPLDRFYDALMIVFFVGLWALGFHSAGLEGLVAIGVGIAAAFGIYVLLFSPLLALLALSVIIAVASEFVLPVVRRLSA